MDFYGEILHTHSNSVNLKHSNSNFPLYNSTDVDNAKRHRILIPKRIRPFNSCYDQDDPIVITCNVDGIKHEYILIDGIAKFHQRLTDEYRIVGGKTRNSSGHNYLSSLNPNAKEFIPHRSITPNLHQYSELISPIPTPIRTSDPIMYYHVDQVPSPTFSPKPKTKTMFEFKNNSISEVIIVTPEVKVEQITVNVGHKVNTKQTKVKKSRSRKATRKNSSGSSNSDSYSDEEDRYDNFIPNEYKIDLTTIKTVNAKSRTRFRYRKRNSNVDKK